MPYRLNPKKFPKSKLCAIALFWGMVGHDGGVVHFLEHFSFGEGFSDSLHGNSILNFHNTLETLIHIHFDVEHGRLSMTNFKIISNIVSCGIYIKSSSYLGTV